MESIWRRRLGDQKELSAAEQQVYGAAEGPQQVSERGECHTSARPLAYLVGADSNLLDRRGLPRDSPQLETSAKTLRQPLGPRPNIEAHPISSSESGGIGKAELLRVERVGVRHLLQVAPVASPQVAPAV